MARMLEDLDELVSFFESRLNKAIETESIKTPQDLAIWLEGHRLMAEVWVRACIDCGVPIYCFGENDDDRPFSEGTIEASRRFEVWCREKEIVRPSEEEDDSV